MKLIKKIAAIMFAFMMVVSMSCNVKAEETEGVYGQKDGSITITNPKDKQTYNLYKILNLDSYSYESGKPKEGNYSYSLAGNDWDKFIKDNSTDDGFFTITNDKYVTFNAGKSAEELAKAAIQYAKDKSIPADKTSNTIVNGQVKFDSLQLGYYLVDSTVGSLCNLTTTNSTVEIQEKNDVPTVEKSVSSSEQGTYGNSCFANIGDKVYFKSEITVKDGAENYVLHDKMDDGLTLDTKSVKVKLNDKFLTQDTDFQVITNITDESENSKCTFHITFKDGFYNEIKSNNKVTVTYSAILNENAFIGHDENSDGNKNKTWLGYGDSKITVESKVNVFTLKLPVYKYTMKDGTKTGLKNAKFKLYDSNNKIINLVKLNETEEVYRKALGTETSTIQEIMTTNTGKFTIQGLAPGTYYLEETEAPKGYNKLVKKIKVEIQENGTLVVDEKATVENKPITQVDVENKSGTLLPNTGGAGTTMIYLVGALLVLGSGVVLASKRKSNSK